MKNKLGKIIGLATLAGAAAAGVYYFLLKDDVEEVDSNDGKDIKKFFSEDKVQPREYVSLNKKADATEEAAECCDDSSKDAIKAKLDEAAKEAAEKEVAEKDGVGVIKESVAENAEEFEFEDLETEED